MFIGDTNHAAYAYDLSSAEKLNGSLRWWHGLVSLGPKMRYYLKPTKTWLITNPVRYESTKLVFQDTNINVTSDEKRHLGAVIGRPDYRQSYVETKVVEWVKQLALLSEIATFYPQATYCAFTSVFRQKFNLHPLHHLWNQ